MRQPTRFLLIILALCTSASLAFADARSDARTHYGLGQKAYAASDYKLAIKEFSAAQDLAPADLNNYNLALCYDKIGDADNALSYYKQYLDKVPDAPKRAEIEASMARLDGAKKSAAGKKADADKKAQADSDAKKVEEDKKVPVVAPPVVAPPVATEPPAVPLTGQGSTGTPSSGLTVTTGDAQLDRVQGINIDQIRDQRMGGASSGMPAQQNGGPNNQNVGPQGGPQGGPQPNGMAAMNGPQNNPNGPNGAPLPGDKPAVQQDTPVYKKWWFWVVVAVSAYVVYEIATQDSSSTNNARMFEKDKNAGMTPVSPGGYTLMRF